jgi:ABC-type glycerol-3-phosphate transport system substrate-binding protein
MLPIQQALRRRVLVAGAALGVAAPFVRGAHAAGKLSVGFWDHWVPGANDAMRTIIKEWADKEKVEVQVDFITTQGSKLLLTGAARIAGQGRPRHPGAHLVPAGALFRPAGAGRRPDGRADQAK